MLTLDELKKLHDKAYIYGQVTRDRASDDLVFYWISQWDDQLLQDAHLSYRGQFDVLRKAGRQIMSELRSNPIQVDFQPINEGRQDAAELLDGMYRKDDKSNSSIEAYDYSTQDSVVCGFGAWEMFNEYETNIVGDENQVIKRRYIPEACNTAFCDPNAKTIDKSDAMYWSILCAYSSDGYKDLVHELTGNEMEQVNHDSFKSPNQSYVFPWVSGQGEQVYVTNFYHREMVNDVAITLISPIGEEIFTTQSEIDDFEDELIDFGFEIVNEKKIKRWSVTKYIASGGEILNGEMGPDGERLGEQIACEYIPVIPVYGERSYIEGEEHYEGITRLAKDPQRLYNFVNSYLADITSKSPRAKPIFGAMQIQGLEHMYELNGSDNNYPYLIQHLKDPNGNDLPAGPVGMMPETPIPQSLSVAMDVARRGVEDVANPGLPQDIADPDLSGKAVLALQNRLDQQSYIYQHNLKSAKRYDGMVYASFARHLYNQPKKVKVELPDGTQKSIQIMETVIDDHGNPVVINDLTNVEFDVYSDIGPSYKTQKEESLDKLNAIIKTLPPGDPNRDILIMKSITMMDGESFKDVRPYFRRQLILKGVIEPETEEEIATVQAAKQAQQNQPDAAMTMAQAEMMKGQAAIAEQENKNKQIQIEMAKADTGAVKVGIDAQKAKADIANTNADTLKKAAETEKISGETISNRVDTIGKIFQPTSQI